MQIHSLLTGGCVIALLAGVYSASRLFLSNSGPEAVSPAIAQSRTSYNGVASGRPGPPRLKPSRSIDSPIYSPDGRFIAFHLIKNRVEESLSSGCVLDAKSGKVLGCGEEAYEPQTMYWKGPKQLNVGDYSYSLIQDGAGWKFDRGTGAPQWDNLAHPPATFSGRKFLNVNNEKTLRHADLAVWFLRSPSSGTGILGASSIATGQEIAIPFLQKPTYVSHTAEFAAPPYKIGSPRFLAVNYRTFSFNSRLEVWNLAARRRLFQREYNDSINTPMHWTRDGRFLVVMNVERAPQGFDSMDGIDVFDTRTGKLSNALSLPIASNGIQTAPTVSHDGRYLLTRERNSSKNRDMQRLAVREIPNGRIVCTIERNRPITTQPKFAEHDPNLLIWASKDTIFIQRWKASKKPQKLQPLRFTIALNSPDLG